MDVEPLIRIQNLSAPSLNMELFSVITKAAWGVPLSRFSVMKYTQLRISTLCLFFIQICLVLSLSQACTHAHFVIYWKIIVKNDTLYENSSMKRHFITRWPITATICSTMFRHSSTKLIKTKRMHKIFDFQIRRQVGVAYVQNRELHGDGDVGNTAVTAVLPR